MLAAFFAAVMLMAVALDLERSWTTPPCNFTANFFFGSCPPSSPGNFFHAFVFGAVAVFFTAVVFFVVFEHFGGMISLGQLGKIQTKNGTKKNEFCF
jgi:hypothetical protein